MYPFRRPLSFNYLPEFQVVFSAVLTRTVQFNRRPWVLKAQGRGGGQGACCCGNHGASTLHRQQHITLFRLCVALWMVLVRFVFGFFFSHVWRAMLLSAPTSVRVLHSRNDLFLCHPGGPSKHLAARARAFFVVCIQCCFGHLVTSGHHTWMKL